MKYLATVRVITGYKVEVVLITQMMLMMPFRKIFLIEILETQVMLMLTY